MLARLGAVCAAAAIAGCTWVALAKVPVTNVGDALVDRNGMTLYTFDRDPDFESVCNGQCAAAWPPLIATTASRGAGDYAIIARDDGRRQWAYRGKPLYLSARDWAPGEHAGDGAENLWRVARP